MSDVKPVFFIVTFLERGKIVHQIAPNKEGKYKEQNYDDAAIVLDMNILDKEECQHPVSPPNVPASKASSSSERQNDKCSMHAATETRPGGNCQIMRGSIISGNV